ncbi:DUF1700 domain-containing protein [Breznakia sp. OttesenSCG-928-G09]|nr:DUF1700 domain-containing protein [Breznakia sp. OttesenSCG-928-G09]
MNKYNRKDYMRDLAYHLRDLQKEEFEDAIHYVEEYFDEAGEENEQKVIDELGSPQKLAATIRAESTIKKNRSKQNTNEKEGHNPYYRHRSNGSDLKALWIIVLGIFALPIALPLVLAVFLLVLAFFIVIAALIVAGIACTIALIIVAIPSFISSFVLLGINFMAGITALGVSFILLGVGLLLLAALSMAITRFVPWAIRCVSNLFNRFSHRRPYAAQS